jgi:hypothetical protein
MSPRGQGLFNSSGKSCRYLASYTLIQPLNLNFDTVTLDISGIFVNSCKILQGAVSSAAYGMNMTSFPPQASGMHGPARASSPMWVYDEREQSRSFGWPLVTAGRVKIIYDVLLLGMFRTVLPWDEAASEASRL